MIVLALVLAVAVAAIAVCRRNINRAARDSRDCRRRGR